MLLLLPLFSIKCQSKYIYYEVECLVKSPRWHLPYLTVFSCVSTVVCHGLKFLARSLWFKSQAPSQTLCVLQLSSRFMPPCQQHFLMNGLMLSFQIEQLKSQHAHFHYKETRTGNHWPRCPQILTFIVYFADDWIPLPVFASICPSGTRESENLCFYLVLSSQVLELQQIPDHTHKVLH